MNYDDGYEGQKRRPNNEGYSLIELLVVMAVMGILVLALTSIFTQQLKMSNYLDFRSEASNFLYEIRNNLSIGDSCKKSFIDIATNINQAHVPQVVDDGGNVLVTEGQDVVGRLTIVSIATENKNVPPAGGEGIMELVFTIESKKQVQGNKTLVRKLPVKVEANAAGVIQNCGTGGAIIWDNCYIKQATYGGGADQEVTCDNPDDKMVSAICFPIGSEDGPANCDLRMNSIYIWPRRDPWGVKLRCCPTN